MTCCPPSYTLVTYFLDICDGVACFDPGFRSDTAVPQLAKKDFPCMCGCHSWKRYTVPRNKHSQRSAISWSLGFNQCRSTSLAVSGVNSLLRKLMILLDWASSSTPAGFGRKMGLRMNRYELWKRLSKTEHVQSNYILWQCYFAEQNPTLCCPCFDVVSSPTDRSASLRALLDGHRRSNSWAGKDGLRLRRSTTVLLRKARQS